MSAASPDLLAAGSRLGKYEILRLLNVGGMGELYLARTAGIEGFEKLVALKRILPQFAARSEFEQMLLDEARLMATLHHPNIVQVYDVGRHDGSTFFTMEYVHGENLRNVLKAAASRARGLSLSNALWIVSNVAAGLHYAHEKKRADGTPLLMIHRDVSPNNIMLTHDGAIKLVDFGVAKAVARQAKTTPGAIKGNVRYMSPEQCLGDPMDRRSDIFSLGIVLFELTTGTRWIRERDDYQAVQKMLNEPFPRPTERRTKYHPELERIVMRALARQPEDRFQTARELQREIEEFALENKLALSSVVMGETMHGLFESSANWSTERELQRVNKTLASSQPGAAAFAPPEALAPAIPTTTAPMSRSPLDSIELPPTQPGVPPPPPSRTPLATSPSMPEPLLSKAPPTWLARAWPAVVALGILGCLFLAAYVGGVFDEASVTERGTPPLSSNTAPRNTAPRNTAPRNTAPSPLASSNIGGQPQEPDAHKPEPVPVVTPVVASGEDAERERPAPPKPSPEKSPRASAPKPPATTTRPVPTASERAPAPSWDLDSPLPPSP